MTFMEREQTRHIGNWAALGPAVRDARTRAGLTQAALAERAGVSRGWLVRFEAGLPNAEPVRVFRLLDTLGLHLTLTPRTRPDFAFPDTDVVVERGTGDGWSGIDIDALLARLDEPDGATT